MNGKQIETMLSLIDKNVDLTRREAMQYLHDHQSEVARELARNGRARVPTSAGDLSLSIEDLTAAAVR